jgi:hypothetical protein
MSLMYLHPEAEAELLLSEMIRVAMSTMTIRHRIEVRTLIRRMVAIMTIERQALKRERAIDWPIFAEMSFPEDTWVVSIEIKRSVQELISHAVTQAAATLALALRGAFPELSSMLLVAIGSVVPLTSKVATLKAQRSGLWSDLEERGMVLPNGERAEARLEYDGKSLGYAGAITTGCDQFDINVELTRAMVSVCIGGPLGPQLYRDITSSGGQRPLDKAELLRESVARLDSDSFVVRGFGGFDDRIVGIEAFLIGRRADLLEKSARLALQLLRYCPDVTQGSIKWKLRSVCVVLKLARYIDDRLEMGRKLRMSLASSIEELRKIE